MMNTMITIIAVLRNALRGRMVALVIALTVVIIQTRADDTQFVFDGNGNLLTAEASFFALPQIVSPPQTQVVAPGALASFFVVAADTRALAYQWHFNGTNLAGATGDALLITNVAMANEGQYSVVLMNSSGSVTSAPAALMIDADGDGLGDSWELTYFGNLNQNVFGDPDGDGSNNLTEFLDGTNPTNSASATFRLTLVSDGGGQLAASPTKLSYTNGEMVTITATPFPGGIFHFWSGEAVTRNNPVTLVMTNNKALSAHFNGFTFSWTNAAGGDWHNPSNWSPNLVPTAIDDVAPLPSVTITINAPAECRNLTFSGGTLTGSGDLTIHGDATWTGGTMSGGGKTIVEPGATLTMNSPTFTLNLARPLENGGTVVWMGNVGMSVNNAVITNRPGALFHVQNSQLGSGGGSSRFDNAGTFRKSAHSGTTTFNIPFNNYGDMDLQTGTLHQNASFINNGSVTVAAGTTHRISSGSASGTFSAPAASLVEWPSGTFTLTAGAELNGTGTYRLNGATVNFDTDVVVQNLELLTGTFSGSGSVTVSNAMAWSSGGLTGSGRTIIAPGATLTMNSPTFTLNLARPLENGGTVVWMGNVGMSVNNTVITNRPGALFHVQNSQTISTGGGTPRFDNAGTFRKSTSSGTTTVNIPFNNYGLVESMAGTLSLNGGGSHVGSFAASNSTTLSFSGTHSLSAASSIVGAGNLSVSGGVFTHSGFANVTGTNSFSGGTANLNGDYICTNNTVIVSGGVVNFNGTGLVSPATVNLSSGTLGGSSLMTVVQQMNWTSGTMGGTGRTIIEPGATLTMNSPTFTLNLARPLENGGTVVWMGNVGMSVNNAVITNRPGALFHVQNSQTLIFGSGTPRFDNAGTFRKSTSSGTTTFNIPFNNYGDMDLQTGTLYHNASFINNGSVMLAAGATHRMGSSGSASGTFNAPTTALVEWPGGTFTLNTGAQLNGAGLYRINGGALACNTDVTVQFLDLSGTLNGSGVVTVSSAMNWTSGTMGGTGRTIIEPGATLTMNSPTFTLNLARPLENGGTVVWMGNVGMSVNNTIITNRPGALFHVQNSQTLGSGGGTPRFDNAGTFRKSTSSGTTTFNIPFNNYGDMDLQTGTLYHNASFINNGSVVLVAGTTHRMGSSGSASGTFNAPTTALVEWPGGTFTLNTGAQLNGAGLYRINGGTLACNTDVTVQFLDLSGTFNGSGVVTVSSAMNWTSGTMGGIGRTVIPPDATLTMNSPTFTLNLARPLENGGTVVWMGNVGMSVNNAVITNRIGALFHVQNAQSLSFGGGSPRFDNAGTFRKSGNSGTATISSGIPFNNSGTVEIETGILAASGGYTSGSGALLHCVLSGTSVGTGYSRLQVGGTATLNGALSVAFGNGFVPATDNTFTVLTAGTRSGTFSSFIYPSNQVTMLLSNTATSVILNTTAVAPPQPVFLTTTLENSNVRLIWTAASNSTYRVEFIEELGSTNWISLSGDVTTLSNTATKLDALGLSNRFYRVRVLP